MRIAITADLHWGSKEQGDASTRTLIRDLREEDPDVLILAGDIGSGRQETIHQCLDLFSDFSARLLFVAGNHDIWTTDGDSEQIFRETLPEIGKEHGFHYLEGCPVTIDGVGIAGTMGWYDYSLRDESLGIDLVHYERKYLRRVASWNDRRFVRWRFSDRELTDLLVEQLRSTLAALSGDAKEIVVVTHHLPFAELVVRYPEHRAWAFANAYLGSVRLGEVLLEFPRVRHHFCGHSHARSVVNKGAMRSVNVGSTYLNKRYELLEVGPDPI
ncbi:MAG: metallophosphoesterase [Planctomycetota bacterium]|nr:metallophosphoesterase [Planctomycetota bacterium]